MMLQPLHAPTVLFVSTLTGSDSAPGTASAPLATLNAAIGRIGSGTIAVDATAGRPCTAATISRAVPISLAPWNNPTFYVEAGGASNALAITGPGHVTIKGGHFSGGALAGVSFGTTTPVSGLSKLTATDCYAQGAQSGWNGIGRFATADLTRCEGKGGINDGFGFHGIPGDPSVVNVVTMTDCEAHGCGDEAISPHEYVVLNIIGGQFDGAQQSGMAAVGYAVCNISGGAVFDNNGKSPDNNYGGLYYSGNASGTLNGVTLSNNDGPGIWDNTAGTLTLTDYTSTGNGAPDILTP